jgi:hypothetical protein
MKAIQQHQRLIIDPYLLNRPLLEKFKGTLQTYAHTRRLERHFSDFKSFYVDTQFREIYHDLYTACKRGDLVVLQRSLSDPLFEVLPTLS